MTPIEAGSPLVPLSGNPTKSGSTSSYVLIGMSLLILAGLYNYYLNNKNIKDYGQIH